MLRLFIYGCCLCIVQTTALKKGKKGRAPSAAPKKRPTKAVEGEVEAPPKKKRPPRKPRDTPSKEVLTDSATPENKATESPGAILSSNEHLGLNTDSSTLPPVTSALTNLAQPIVNVGMQAASLGMGCPATATPESSSFAVSTTRDGSWVEDHEMPIDTAETTTTKQPESDSIMAGDVNQDNYTVTTAQQQQQSDETHMTDIPKSDDSNAATLRAPRIVTS